MKDHLASQKSFDQPTAPAKKPVKFGLSIAIVSICLVATGVALYWIWTEPVDHVTVNFCTNCKKTPYQTAGWQTYRNEESGFEIRYPGSWTEINSSDSRLIAFCEAPHCDEIHDFKGFEIEVTKSNETNVTKLLLSKEGISYPLSDDFKDSILIEEGVNGGLFTEIAFNPGDFQGGGQKTHYLTKNGDYIIDVMTADVIKVKNENGEVVVNEFGELKDAELFDRILSTFKFIETNPGTIEGSLSYPSDGLPEGMKVCAENTETKAQICTDNHILDKKYKPFGQGYKLGVPAGDYYIFATLPQWKDYRAYYSGFVVCGLRVDCPSHEPIVVKVREGQNIDGIDPHDWYK